MKLPVETFQDDTLRPFGEKEVFRIIVTPFGQKMIKQGALGTLIIGATSVFLYNRLRIMKADEIVNNKEDEIPIIKEASS